MGMTNIVPTASELKAEYCYLCKHYEDRTGEYGFCPAHGSSGVPVKANDTCGFWTLKEELKTEDKVNHPNHYTSGGVECIEGIKAALGDGFTDYCIGNVIKYVWRWRHKGGIEDLNKAQVYLGWAIEKENE